MELVALYCELEWLHHEQDDEHNYHTIYWYNNIFPNIANLEKLTGGFSSLRSKISLPFRWFYPWALWEHVWYHVTTMRLKEMHTNMWWNGNGVAWTQTENSSECLLSERNKHLSNARANPSNLLLEYLYSFNVCSFPSLTSDCLWMLGLLIIMSKTTE